MTKNFIKLNESGFCTEFTISVYPLEDGWIELTDDLYPSNTGQKFDVEKMKWLDEFDESLVLPEPIIRLTEREQMELDNYTNMLYLTALADLGM